MQLGVWLPGIYGTFDSFKLGVEAGAQVYQNIEDKTQGYNNIEGKNVTVSVTAKRWGLDILGVANYFITERFDIFAKLGTAFVHQEFPARFNGNSHYIGEKLYIFLDGQALSLNHVLFLKQWLELGIMYKKI